MKNIIIKNKTSINLNQSVEGEKIETKIERIIVNKEPIDEEAPLIWQERSSGIDPACDIRTDRFDIAIDAMEAVNKSKIAQRENNKQSTEVESIQGTDNKQVEEPSK